MPLTIWETVKAKFYELAWRWKNRKWQNCRAKDRALQRYMHDIISRW